MALRKTVNYSLLGNVSDGLSSLVPDIMANKMQNVASTAKYLLCMGDGQAIDLYVMDGSTPETMKKRVARMDYVDKGVSIVDPPIYKSLSKKFWLRASIAAGVVVLAIVIFKMSGDKKSQNKSKVT